MVHSFGDFTEKFFRENKTELQKHYPGLSSRRLKLELESFCLQSQINVDDLFQSVYIPTLNSPFLRFFELLKKGFPLEYIRERAYFYKSEFSVTPVVLIPRNETEILVEKAIQEAESWIKKTDENLKIADIGTGSGAIILSIIQELNRPTKAIATDISLDALKIARRNYFNLRFKMLKESSVHFIKTDRLSDIDDKFHMIVSNPPYIMEEGDKSQVHGQVDMFEPHLALYLNDQTYFEWFKTLFEQVYSSLLEEGIFIMEGHEDHLEKLKDLILEFGFSEAKVVQDYTSRDRFIIARK